MPLLCDPDVLIVGAGPTGLTAACELVRRGIAVRIIDKAAAIPMTSRAIGLHGRSMEILHDLGIDTDFYAIGETLRAANFIVDGTLVKRHAFPDVDRPFPRNITLPQYRTEALIEARLNALGGTVERGTALDGLEERADGLTATLIKPDGVRETLNARWVIGCDGAHSTVRHLNRQHFPGESDPRSYLLADVVAEGAFPRQEMTQWTSRHGTLVGFPLPGGRYQVAGDWHENGDEDPDTAPTLADVAAFVSERTGDSGTVRDPAWITRYRVSYRLTPHYRHGRTFLAGDAAHIHSPFGGRGMNCGIQDAQNLAWKLALVILGKAPHVLLDTYETERRPSAAANVAWTRTTAMPLLDYKHYTPEKRAAVVAGIKAAFSPEGAVDRQLRALEVDTVYPASPVCRAHVRDHARRETFLGGPRPGRLAETAGPLSCAGKPVALIDILRGPHFTLLAFAGSDPGACDIAAMRALVSAFADRLEGIAKTFVVVPGNADSADAGCLCDSHGTLHAAYGASEPGLYLIRPDGYVAFRNQPPSLVALRGFLDAALSPPVRSRH